MNFAKPLSRVCGVVVIAMTIVSPLSALGATDKAAAKVTAFLSAGPACDGAPSASFKADGAPVKVSLCVASTTEILCGHTTKLQAADARTSGRFNITAVVLGPNFSDPNNELTFPIAITNPSAVTDLGSTVSRAVVPTAARQLLATFDVSPQPNANDAVYVISLAPTSSVGVGADGACTLPSDSPIAASFKLIHRSGKETKK